MLPVNEAQAMLPDGCTVLPNPRGTAMGMWFDASQDGQSQVVISMPGVPYEMKGLVEEEVLPRVLSKWDLPTRYHRTVLTQGIGESYLSKIVHDWEEDLAQRGEYCLFACIRCGCSSRRFQPMKKAPRGWTPRWRRF